jgi:hypothetical protein
MARGETWEGVTTRVPFLVLIMCATNTVGTKTGPFYRGYPPHPARPLLTRHAVTPHPRTAVIPISTQSLSLDLTVYRALWSATHVAGATAALPSASLSAIACHT